MKQNNAGKKFVIDQHVNVMLPHLLYNMSNITHGGSVFQVTKISNPEMESLSVSLTFSSVVRLQQAVRETQNVS